MSEEKKTDKELKIQELEDKVMMLEEDIDLYNDIQDRNDLIKVKARLAELRNE